MRVTIAVLIVIGLLWSGYIVWPLYDLYVLVRAIETRDSSTVVRYVYFDQVRQSLTQQLVATYMRRSGTPLSPLAQSMAAAAVGIADPVINKLVSSEGVSELLATGWPITVLPDAPSGAVGITTGTLGTVWQIFGNSEYGIGRFEVSAPASLAPPHRFRLTFRLLQWRWRLTSVGVPENIQHLLVNEIIKSAQPPTQRP